MIKIKNLHHWTPLEVYAAYAEALLKEHPGTEEVYKDRRRKRDGSLGEKVTRKRVVGGYWGKRNRNRQINNFWIYTEVKGKVTEVINYDRWKAVMEAYFTKARERITTGEALNLGGMLGRILPIHIERNHSKGHIDFHETKKQPRIFDPVTGKHHRQRIIYRTDDTYVRIGWRRARRITGEGMYEFVPSGKNINGNGFKQQFSQANIRDPLLRLQYPFSPYTLKGISDGIQEL